MIPGQNNIPDRLALLFENQLSAFPQEKIYFHTDKPYYITGERIWFRAHLADAMTHIPSPVSRYVYVELINPLDSIVTRVKIRSVEDAYYGYLLIPDDIPEGDYTMRAYTTFMRSQDENYFCTKTIRIGDPQARAISVNTKFTFESDKKVNVQFRFSHINLSSTLVPKSVKISVNGEKPMNVRIDDEGAASISFNLPAVSRKRTMLLELVAFEYPYRQFINIPVPDDDFDVSFYPEGGSLIQGTRGKIAFKAMKSNGQSTNITGVVYDRTGNEITHFNSAHTGMGIFFLYSENGNAYYAICTNDQGQSKRFELPAAVDHGYSLSVSQYNDRFFVSVPQPAGTVQREELYLLAHTRGEVLFVTPWEHTNDYVDFSKSQFPSGVLHLILFNSNMNPVSERLVFNHNNDQAQVSYQHDRDLYTARLLVKNKIVVTDEEGEPLTGSFSIAVTSDREVTPDSTSNILTHFLLTSDLRGHIENPAYYFQNNVASVWALDLLMLTQGWRRYNISELSQGSFSLPTCPVEIGAEISGIVKGVLTGKPVADVEVTVMSLQGDYFDNTVTDQEGRFYFRGGELPDSVLFVASAVPRRGMTRMDLILDRETFPERSLTAAPPVEVDKNQFARYAHKADQKYTYEHGERMLHLSEVTIVAERKTPRKSHYYGLADHSITEEELEKIYTTDIKQLLMRFPGVYVASDGSINIRGVHSILGSSAPLIIIDGVPGSLDMLSIHDIAQIDVLKNASNTAIYGLRGTNGVIVIYTKKGSYFRKDVSTPFHIKTILPLGYQNTVEFYAPKYDTPQKRDAPTPDLRTTIHWQPDVRTDSAGVASFDFYTADDPVSYTVIIEGLTNDGKIIRQEKKLWQ